MADIHEVEDLGTGDVLQKLAVSEALSEYQQAVAERQRLEVLDSVRLFKNRLEYVEPLYGELYEEYLETLRYIEELKYTLKTKKLELSQHQKRSEAELRTAHSECASIQGKLRTAEKELQDIRNTTKHSITALFSERDSAINELAGAHTEHQLTKERSKALEVEVESMQELKTKAEEKARNLQSDIVDCKRELKNLKAKYDAGQKEATTEREELESQIAALQQEVEDEKGVAEKNITVALQKGETSRTTKKELSELRSALTKETKAREKAEQDIARMKEEQEASSEMVEVFKVTKKELSELRSSLTKETKAREKAEKDLIRFQEGQEKATQKEEASKITKKELSDLRTALAKETKAREKAERDFARFKDDQESKLEVLRKQLEVSKVKLKETKEAPVTARTANKDPLANPRKRSSSTILTMEDLANSVKKPRTKASTTSEFSMTPFLKRQALVTAGDASLTDDSVMDRTVPEHPGDKSIIVPSVIDSNKPARLLFAGANRRKRPPKAAARIPEELEDEVPISETAPVTTANEEKEDAEDEDEEVGEDSMLMLRPPPVAKPKSKARGKTSAKPAPKPARPKSSLLSSSPEPPPPPPTEVEKKQPQRRRKKPVGEATFMGIKPTLFDDDDGTGRLNINLDDASQGVKGTLTHVPGIGAFKKEISPSKKRPAAMGKLFGKF